MMTHNTCKHRNGIWFTKCMFSKRTFFSHRKHFNSWFWVCQSDEKISLKKSKKIWYRRPSTSALSLWSQETTKRQKSIVENAMVDVIAKRNMAKTIPDCQKFNATKCLLQCSFWDLKKIKVGQKTLNGGKKGGFQNLYIKMLVHCSSYMYLFCARPLTSWLLISFTHSTQKYRCTCIVKTAYREFCLHVSIGQLFLGLKLWCINQVTSITTRVHLH